MNLVLGVLGMFAITGIFGVLYCFIYWALVRARANAVREVRSLKGYIPKRIQMRHIVEGEIDDRHYHIVSPSVALESYIRCRDDIAISSFVTVTFQDPDQNYIPIAPIWGKHGNRWEPIKTGGHMTAPRKEIYEIDDFIEELDQVDMEAEEQEDGSLTVHDDDDMLVAYFHSNPETGPAGGWINLYKE